MVKRVAVIIIVVIVAIIGVIFVKRALTSDEAKVRGVCQKLGELVSAPADEKLTTIVLRTERIKKILADSCRFEVKTYRMSDELSKEEVVSRYVAVRQMVESADVKIKDVELLSLDGDTASVTFTVRATGTIGGRSKESRTAAVIASLKKVEGKWVFTEFVEETVLEK